MAAFGMVIGDAPFLNFLKPGKNGGAKKFPKISITTRLTKKSSGY
jgi:hypothetical protein